MSIGRQDQAWRKGLWYSGKVARRRFLGLGVAAAGALGASMLVPAPWRQAFGAARPYKIGSVQPLTGAGAIAGRSALIGLEVAMQRINASGGINGRPVELVVRDDHSRTDTGRRAAEELVTTSRIDVHQGGFLSDVCLACLSIWERHKIVNMIGACLDTRITTTRCSRYSFRPFDYSPAQAVAFAPSLIKMGKRWHIIYSDYTWGQSTRDAYANEIRWRGGEIAGTTAVPVGTADMRPFLQTIALFRRPSRHLFRPGRRARRNPGVRSGAHEKVSLGGRWCHCHGNQSADARRKDRRVRWHRPLSAGLREHAGFAVPPEVVRGRPRGREKVRSARCQARSLYAIELRGPEFPAARDAEVQLQWSGRHAETHRRPRRHGGSHRGRLPPRRQEAPQRRPSGIHRRVHIEVRNGQHRILATVPWQQTLQQPACSFA